MPDALPQMPLIGLNPNPDWMPPAVLRLIGEAEVLAGGERLLDLFPGHPGRKLPLTTPLNAWLRELKACREEGRRVVVLTSGDPNYFGLAKRLLEIAGPEGVTVIPSTTVIQEAFARLKVSWERATVVSLHGRTGLVDFWSALYRASHHAGSGYVAVYTDPENTPALIAKRLLGRGQQNWRLHVFEDLGSPDERVTSWTLYEAKLRRFSALNLVVLECLKRPAPISLGLPEGAYVHEAGLITKREVRAVTLGLLEIQPFHTLWDLGAGSGSVSIEAAYLLPYGSVWAVEKSPLRSEQVAANRAYFGAAQVEIVEDDALSAIVHLPPPDRVFIGGGGKDLGDIIRAARAKLNPDGLMVANVVTLEALHLATEAMAGAGLEVSVTQLQAARSETLADSLYLKPLNQVWLVRGAVRGRNAL